ncbi:MAG: YihY/virulence factor BrkB family protein, partial [Planctomycetes bacterium]|nr:YihY/virulence factor BrkB family protein [Planctomycetota bacterium]
MRLLRRIRRFLLEDIWRVDLAHRSRVTRLLVHLLRTVILAIRGLSRHRSSVWAASLTYVSLMSVIPFIALVAGLGARLGVPGKAVESLTGQIPDEQIGVLRTAAEAFEKADLKALGVVAFLVLLWAMVKALTGVEKALNEIWGAERGRSFLKRLSNYVSVAVLGPLLILSGMALTAAIMSSTFMARVEAIPVAGKGAHFLLSAGPYLTAWLGLALLYWLLPNARVRFFSGAVGAVVAGVLWQLMQRLYFGAQ